MVFALNRSAGGQKNTETKERRSPLAGWLGKKNDAEAPDELPEIDVIAGLNRVLKATAPQQAEPQRKGPQGDPVREALACIESALYSVDQIRETIEEAYEVVFSAQDVEDVGGRALLAESYDDLRQKINDTIDNLDDRAAALIGRNQRNLDVRLGGKAQYSISPTRLDVSARGLNLEPPRHAFATFEEISDVLAELDTALKKADRAAAGYCRDAQFLIARLSQETAA